MANKNFITDLLKSLKTKYQAVLDDAIDFYSDYSDYHAVYEKEVGRCHEVENQINTINTYKKQHGTYPQIKDHPDVHAYVSELIKIKERASQQIAKVEPTIIEGYKRRSRLIGAVAKPMIDMLLTDRDASQFIATMMLRAPMPDDRARCVNNEINKPLYIAALSISLLRRLYDKGALENEFIKSLVPDMIQVDGTTEVEYEPGQLARFEKYVLTPIITACLIHNIGSYSKEALSIYKGDRYQVFDDKQRKILISAIYEQSKKYLTFGLGDPRISRIHMDEQEHHMDEECFELCEDILKNYSKADDPDGNLLRIPMIYASFMLSTKQRHDYLISFKGYDILKSGIDNKIIYQPYAEHFLNMVGRYPLGTGIFFYSKETEVPERAVVTGLNPPKPTSAIVKQLTRKQLQFDDHTQVCVNENTILSNKEAREASRFDAKYYQKQFPNGYFWNASEVWELGIDHQQFWRRDNNLKQN